MVEMHARDVRDLKRVAEALAGLPDLDCGSDGTVALAPVAPEKRQTRKARAPRAAGAVPPSGDGKKCEICGKAFRPKTSEKTCSTDCRLKRQRAKGAEYRRAAAARNRPAKKPDAGPLARKRAAAASAEPDRLDTMRQLKAKLDAEDSGQ